jgi:RNA polymerase sigma-70 factor (ECF subfamily)
MNVYQRIEDEIPRLRRYARALTRDLNAADDLVQDCLARALSKVHLWQNGTDLRAWLFTILHNQYVNHVRRAVREGASVGLSETEPNLTSAPNQGKRLELRDLERAIAKLPEEQRSVLLLVGLEGMRYEEVAAVLDVPVGTIRSRLSRGRDTLRHLMGMSPETADAGEPPRDANSPPLQQQRASAGPTTVTDEKTRRGRLRLARVEGRAV